MDGVLSFLLTIGDTNLGEVTMVESLQYGFSKDKLPRAFSYPLKRSLLDVALDEVSVTQTVYSVRYLFGRGTSSTTLHAWFTPESSGAHVSVSGKSLITVWAVPREQRKSCEDLFIDAGLPILCRWLAQTATAGNVWRSTQHELSLVVRDGKLTHEKS